jgi:hypothetical protein
MHFAWSYAFVASMKITFRSALGDSVSNFCDVVMFEFRNNTEFLQTPRVMPFARKFVLLVNIVLWLHGLIITLLCQLPVT